MLLLTSVKGLTYFKVEVRMILPDFGGSHSLPPRIRPFLESICASVKEGRKIKVTIFYYVLVKENVLHIK